MAFEAACEMCKDGRHSRCTGKPCVCSALDWHDAAQGAPGIIRGIEDYWDGHDPKTGEPFGTVPLADYRRS